jgi:hypothetical protein
MDANKTASMTNRLAQEKAAAAEQADAHSDCLLLLKNMVTAPFLNYLCFPVKCVLILARESAKVNRGFDEKPLIFC